MPRCQICQKKSGKGNKVSHSNKRTKRRFKPNLHKATIIDEKSGQPKKVLICSKCLKKRRRDS